jgi:hypothetical protein
LNFSSKIFEEANSIFGNAQNTMAVEDDSALFGSVVLQYLLFLLLLLLLAASEMEASRKSEDYAIFFYVW